MRTPRRAAALVATATLVLAACGGDDGGDGADGTTTDGTTGESAATSDVSTGAADRTVVVTYAVLGAVVEQVVGDAATVQVLMPNGIDPHDWEPSARDIEALQDADLVVANGLELEEGLAEALEEAAASGVPVFEASDHIELRELGEGEAADDHADEAKDEDHAGEAEGEGHGHGTEDPHLWMDPIAMASVAEALGAELAAVGIDVGDRAATAAADLTALSAEVDEVLAAVPADRRLLVSGHESLGYFADRYGFELVGAVVPSLTSQAEASAGELAELDETIREAGVTVIFTELGTPADVVDAVAAESGATVVELGTHALPEDGTYRTFMLDIARAVAGALAG